MTSIQFLQGDCRQVLATLPTGSVQTCVTSPPYYGLRDYGFAGQIGLEPTPDAYVAEMVAVFREARRVLRDDGTLWLNIGDSYAMTTRGSGGASHSAAFHATAETGRSAGGRVPGQSLPNRRASIPNGFKPKDLLMIPARVALALQADGWYLRSKIIWHKPNPMPESVRDRPTSAYEEVFLLAKRAAYFYDADAVAEAGSAPRPFRAETRGDGSSALLMGRASRQAKGPSGFGASGTRNLRNVWTITPKPFKGAHFAVMPIDLAARCIRAGSRPGDTVLDPFGGAGTTALAALQLGRPAIHIEANPAYLDIARSRLSEARSEAGLFAA